MFIRELTDINEKQVWGRTGNKMVRKYRCTSGSRKGRVVSKIGGCYSAIDTKKRAKLKLTRARLANRMVKRSKRTKRLNPVSKRLQSLNKTSKV